MKEFFIQLPLKTIIGQFIAGTISDMLKWKMHITYMNIFKHVFIFIFTSFHHLPTSA